MRLDQFLAMARRPIALLSSAIEIIMFLTDTEGNKTGQDMTDWLPRFVEESNRIEGIAHTRPVEIQAHKDFLSTIPTIDTLTTLVAVCAPSNRLRDQRGLNVTVGSHIAPEGGPEIRGRLKELLFQAHEHILTPYTLHCDYERLHPFTDGNGRSGRALWLWMMLRGSEHDIRMAKGLGFLHTFYYQALGEFRE